MIVPDLNLLIYAYDSISPFHSKAATWWQTCLSGEEPVLLPEVVVFGFVRLVTSGRAFHQPLATADAIALVRSWLGRDRVSIHLPTPDHHERVLALLQALGTAGNLVTDAQIAAVAIANQAVVHTADADFVRFEGLRWQNPLAGRAPISSRRRRF